MISDTSTEWALVGLFAIHLIAFAALTWRRRTWQFAPAMTTFALLVGLNACKALDVGSETLHDWLRGLAWLGLALSVVTWLRRRATKRLDA